MERRRLPCGLTVWVATTDAQYQRGLGGMTRGHEVDGMLFCLPDDKRWPVHALDLRHGVHVYWISKHGGVVAKSYLPLECSVYHVPIIEARYVLELWHPQDWDIGQEVDLCESVGSTNARVGAAERIGHVARVLDDGADSGPVAG